VAGFCGEGVCVGAGCAAAIDAAANKKTTQRARLIIVLSFRQVSEAARVYLAPQFRASFHTGILIAIKTQEFLKGCSE